MILFLAACGGNDLPQGQAADTLSTSGEDQEAQEEHPYRAVLTGALQDTLSGDAAFGVVVDSETGQRSFIIEMQTPGDLGGSLYLVRRDTVRPQTGTFELVSAADTAKANNRFALVYREGMRRRLTSSQGQLEITRASDSLLVGTFQAEMRGRIKERGAQTGGDDQEADTERVHISGDFRAEQGAIGYLFGL